jgi:D-glycero-alpha-D-manno-heptose-7-phosphate kinase
MYNSRMIMTKTPLRITFVGGGTDLPSFYKAHGPGAVVSAAINKYIYIIVNKKFDDKIRVSYSVTEIVDKVEQIKHPTIREALRLLKIDGGIEIVSISDIPSEGTGLGSSSSFLVGLLNALHAWRGELASPKQLAEEAVKIEREILKEPGGKQDQYIAAYGGIQFMEFNSDESVVVKPVLLQEEKRVALRDSLILMYTGKDRKSTDIHRNQMKETHNKAELYKKMKDLAGQLYNSLSKGRIEETGKMLHENWLLKKQLASGISDQNIDVMYNSAISAGAEGGKLIGAGGGGFMLFYAKKDKHKKINEALRLRLEPFDFESLGSRIIHVGE